MSAAQLLETLGSSDLTPYGAGSGWMPPILWLHMGADLMIAAACYSIPVALVAFVRRRRDVPFHWIFLMFGAFIFLCGTTHALSGLTVWLPFHGLEGLAKLLTALASVATAVCLVPLLPRALALPGLETTVRELTRTTEELVRSNADLERFNRAALGREERIVELKQEVNRLSREIGISPPYHAV